MINKFLQGLVFSGLILTANWAFAEPECSFGQLEASSLKRIANHNYVSVKQGNVTYIHIQLNPPIYVKQASHQFVTATGVQNLPPEVQKLFVDTIRNRSVCFEEPLYLSTIR